MLVWLTATYKTASGGTTESWGHNVGIIIVVLFLTKSVTSGHEINFFFQVYRILVSKFFQVVANSEKVVGFKTKGHWKW